MLFNRNTLTMDDDKLLADLPKWLRKADAYDVFKQALDLSVDRVQLSADNREASKQGGDLLFSYLSKGYLCLGNYIGKPKPDMSHHGVLTVLREKGVGFYIKKNT